ncbi:hypothetical protein [Nostoc sp.]|uniref:hypothetical protein n=1 Tax=Nostoc sp. TaxID=1180 RepID=UPI002FF70F91
MNNWWKGFFVLRPSSVFILFFGILTGFIGYEYSHISKNPSEENKIIWYYFGSTAITLGSIKWIDSIVSKEIDAITDTNSEKRIKEIDAKAETDLDNRIEEKMNQFESDYSQELKDLEKDIYKLEITREQRDEIIRKFESIRKPRKKYEARRKVNKEIASWLNYDDNKKKLLEVAMNSVSNSTCQIDEECKDKLNKNINECIIWLRYSVEDGQARKFQPERYASAMIKVSPGTYEAYKIALNAIKETLENQQETKELYKQTSTVKIMIQYLIDQIQELSEKKINSLP